MVNGLTEEERRRRAEEGQKRREAERLEREADRGTSAGREAAAIGAAKSTDPTAILAGQAALAKTPSPVPSQPQVPIGAQTELTQELGEAGVFKEAPELVPIISPEMENAGVLLDMALALIPEPFHFFPEKVLGIKPKGRKEMEKAKERVTETELALQNSMVNNALATEITKRYDEEIEAELVQMGLGPGLVIGAVGSGFIGSFAQLIGTDKKVKNLTTGIVKLETIATDIASTVVKGDMSFEEGIQRIQYIEAILDNMEAELQLAAIESANVRISLKGRDVAVKILSARSRLDTSIKEIGGFKVAGIIQDSPAHQKAAALAIFKEKWEGK